MGITISAWQSKEIVTMKWLKAVLSVVVVAAMLMTVPSGCGGSGKIEKTKATGEVPAAPGHAAAAASMGKKPEAEKK
jgi:hypothetical protein